jgi:hypothetical protein
MAGGNALPTPPKMSPAAKEHARWISRALAAEAERDALLPIKESWSQLKKDLDEARAERDRYRQALERIGCMGTIETCAWVRVALDALPLTEPEES